MSRVPIASLVAILSSLAMIGAFYTEGAWRGACIGTACGLLAGR